MKNLGTNDGPYSLSFICVAYLPSPTRPPSPFPLPLREHAAPSRSGRTVRRPEAMIVKASLVVGVLLGLTLGVIVSLSKNHPPLRLGRSRQESPSLFPNGCSWENGTVTYGTNIVCTVYNDREIPIHIYRPSSYRDNPIVIIAPGRSGNADQFILENVAMAEFLNVVIVTADWFATDLSYFQTLYGGIFSDDSFNETDHSLLPDAKPRPRNEWVLGFVPIMYHITSTLLHEDPSKVPYILYGDDAGGIFIQQFALTLYYHLPPDDRPLRMVAGISAYYLMPVYPILNEKYLQPVNSSECFNQEIPKLVKYETGHFKDFQKKVIELTDNVGDNNAAQTMSYLLAYMGQTFLGALNEKLLDFEDKEVYKPFDDKKHLPYPYGIKGLVPSLFSTYIEALNVFASVPMTIYLTSRDTNPNGGVTVTCLNAPDLINNEFSVPQGPYRLARGLNFFLTTKAACQRADIEFRWD